MSFINQIISDFLKADKTMISLMNSLEIWFIPMLNVDALKMIDQYFTNTNKLYEFNKNGRR